MPNCVSFKRKISGERVTPHQIDNELCYYNHVEPHPEAWHDNWMNTIGFVLACGHGWDKAREIFDDKLNTIDFLEHNYVPDSWAER